MNRRDAITGAVAGLGAVLGGGTVKAIGNGPSLLVFRPASMLNTEARKNIEASLYRATQGTELEGCKVVVLNKGDDLELITP